MSNFTFPNAAELEMIAQDKMPNLIQNRPIFNEMPIRSVDAALLLWDQMDNFQGLQQVRGLDGAPKRVLKTGVSRYTMEPGTYGEFEEITETDLTLRRVPGTFATPINIDDLVLPIQDKLLNRRLDRIELIGWTLLQSGTFAVANGAGAILHTDSFNVQTYNAPVTWSTSATATPLADFRNAQILQRGHSVDFGADAHIYMNLVTANQLLSNTNGNDLFGRLRLTPNGNVGILNSIPQINQLFAGDNLPQVVVYDGGYISDGADGNAQGSFVPFIGNHKAVLIGRRPAGQPVAEYRMTRNANNPNMAPGAYMRVIDRGESHIPRSVEVHDGHNGGPVIYFPSAVVVMNV